MVNSLYIGLSEQIALRHQMDGIAHNVANLNTAGFKREEVLFREFLVPAEDAGKKVNYSYVLDFGSARDLAEGSMITTGNTFDLAIRGEGFFVIETEQGERYTRNGHFSINDEGTLVTTSGDPVLDQSGRQLSFSPQDGEITISSDGSISAEFAEFGGSRIGVVTFDDLRAMKKAGDGMYETDQIPIDPEKMTVQQGKIESSNVNAVMEMTRMIDVSRRYQTIQRMIDAGYELKRTAIQRLGSVL